MGAKVDARAVSLKKSTGFSRLSVVASLLFFGFLLTQLYFLLVRIDHWNICNRIVIMCTVKTGAEVKCLCSTSEKASLSSGFFVSNRLCLRACVKDTYLALAAILF